MVAQAKVKSPTGLSLASRRFHRAVTDLYELRVDELVLLETACREIDLIEKMRAELDQVDEGELTIPGRYRGTKIAHPLLNELASHRRLLASLLKQLLLPEDASIGSLASVSDRARAAAAARWSKP